MWSVRRSSPGSPRRGSDRWVRSGCASSWPAEPSGLDVDLLVGVGDAHDRAQRIGLARLAVLAPLELLPDAVRMVDADDDHVALRRQFERVPRRLELIEDRRDRRRPSLRPGVLDALGDELGRGASRTSAVVLVLPDDDLVEVAGGDAPHLDDVLVTTVPGRRDDTDPAPGDDGP